MAKLPLTIVPNQMQVGLVLIHCAVVICSDKIGVLLGGWAWTLCTFKKQKPLTKKKANLMQLLLLLFNDH